MIDAWRIETFPARLQGAAMAAYVWGYRFALLVSGAGAIGLADPLGWHGSLLLMAALVGAGPLVTLAAAEPLAERLAREPLGCRGTHGQRRGRAVPRLLAPAGRADDPGLRRPVQARRGDGRHDGAALLSRDGLRPRGGGAGNGRAVAGRDLSAAAAGGWLVARLGRGGR